MCVHGNVSVVVRQKKIDPSYEWVEPHMKTFIEDLYNGRLPSLRANPL